MLKEVMAAVSEKLSCVEALKYSGEDWGQLDNYGDRPPLGFPCALFDVGEVEFTENSLCSQEAYATLKVRVADYRPSNYAESPGVDQFGYFDIVTDVYKALQGLAGSGFSSLSRASLEKVKRGDGIREFEMIFGFTYVDNTAIRNTTSVKVPVQIEVSRKVLISEGS